MKNSIKFTLLMAFLFFSNQSRAQENNDRFFLAFHTSSYLDFVQSPLVIERLWTGDRNPDGSKKMADVPVQSFNLNIFSFGLEPRYNLREFDENSAFAVSIPLSIGLGQAVPINNDVLGASGIGSIQLPILAKLYIGSGSTYKCEKDYGISFGGGLELNKIGLIQLDQSSETNTNKAWIMPVATLGVHFWRGYNPMEINLKYGAGPVKYYSTDQFGNVLRDKNDDITERRAKSQSFRVSLSYLLNY